MKLPDAVKRIAACAPGVRVTVILPAGKRYDLPVPAQAARAEPPHPLEAVSKQLLERDAETRAVVASVADLAARVDQTLKAVNEAVGSVAAGQAMVAQSVSEITEVLHLPVQPVYDKAGKLLGAQRVKELGAK